MSKKQETGLDAFFDAAKVEDNIPLSDAFLARVTADAAEVTQQRAAEPKQQVVAKPTLWVRFVEVIGGRAVAGALLASLCVGIGLGYSLPFSEIAAGTADVAQVGEDLFGGTELSDLDSLLGEG